MLYVSNITNDEFVTQNEYEIKYIIQFFMCHLYNIPNISNEAFLYDDVKDENGKPMPRSGEAIIEDCLVKFNSLDRAERRHILKILRATKKEN